VLASLLPIWRKAEGACSWYLPGCTNCSCAVAALSGPPLAGVGCRPGSTYGNR
jgi:hypothetical protein